MISISRIPLVAAIIALPIQHMPADKEDPALPVPRTTEYPWMSVAEWNTKHAGDVAIAKAGDADLIFVGDSLIQGGSEQEAWTKAFGPYRTANFGIGGDKTQNVLWRLENGAIGTMRPKAVVLLVGVNNFGHNDDTAHEVFRGIKAVVEKLRGAFPYAKIRVCGIFPFDEKPDAPYRQRVKDANKEASSLHDGEHVFFVDIGDQFLERDGTISTSVMADFLHLTGEGYRRWTAAIAPTIHEWME
jgi:lysophospholipase L1-like esterase